MLAKIKNSTYLMQIITLMSGTLIAQVVMFVFVPILTRLYTPSEFGVYSMFYSIVTILGVISSWKYEQAIMLPKSTKDAQALLFLSIVITLGMVCLVGLVILVFNAYFIDYFDGKSLLVWMIPLGVLLTGLLQIFNAFSSRNQLYKQLASVRVANSLSVVGVQSISKYLFKLDGLVAGRLLADLVSLLLLIRFHVKKQTLQLRSLSKRRLRANLKRHENFPKYQSFTAFLNAISQNIPVLLFAILYSAEMAGLYALTVRVLQVPVGLIGSSTREVYYQRASKMYAAGESIFELYKKTTLGLLKIFLLPFLVVVVFGQELFSFVFGQEWIISGEIAQILILWFLFLFINSPSVMTYSILKLQKVQMIVALFSSLIRFFSIYLGYYLFSSFFMSVILFLASSVAVNMFMILFIYFYLKKKETVL